MPIITSTTNSGNPTSSGRTMIKISAYPDANDDNDGNPASSSVGTSTAANNYNDKFGLTSRSVPTGPPYLQRCSYAIPMEFPTMASRSLNKPPLAVFGGQPQSQSGFISIFYSVGSKPMEHWEKQVRTGQVKRYTDTDIRSGVLEIITSINPMSTFITTPTQATWTLGIRLPIIVLVLKNLKRYFVFDVQILDNKKERRRLRFATTFSAAAASSSEALIPLKLEEGWNQVQINLVELTKKIYGTTYEEAIRVQIYANVRLRRVFFCDKLFDNPDIPADVKEFVKNTSK